MVIIWTYLQHTFVKMFRHGNGPFGGVLNFDLSYIFIGSSP